LVSKGGLETNKSRRLSDRKVSFVADGNVAAHVTDLGRAKDFCGSVLGFELLKRTGERLVYGTGKITLYVVKDEKVMSFIPALEVSDYEEARQYLTENGCRTIKEWPGDRALYFEDPFGIVIDVVEKSS
jgi:catechol 2,3-dioxygenase-like lactoylglutathione lyase family enzyme